MAGALDAAWTSLGHGAHEKFMFGNPTQTLESSVPAVPQRRTFVSPEE